MFWLHKFVILWPINFGKHFEAKLFRKDKIIFRRGGGGGGQTIPYNVCQTINHLAYILVLAVIRQRT